MPEYSDSQSMTPREESARDAGQQTPWRAAARYALVLGLAFCSALFLIELVVADIVGFPRRPRNRLITVSNEASRFGSVPWEQPHTSFWNVEGGNIAVRFNNVGLPGCDVEQGPESRYVFVLGSSYVEAIQLDGRFIATSVLGERLRQEHPDYQVLNLGYSGADPYVSYFRARFFETQFPPSCVVLVVESFYADWLRRHTRPLDFSLHAEFGNATPIPFPMRVFRYLREKLALVNMFSTAMSGDVVDRVDRVDRPQGGPAQSTPPRAETGVPEELESCLQAYRQHFASRFVVVLMLPSKEEEDLLVESCRRLGISCVPASGIRRPENRFRGGGHLNVQGNRELGGVLYKAILPMLHAGAGGETRSSPARDRMPENH